MRNMLASIFVVLIGIVPQNTFADFAWVPAEQRWQDAAAILNTQSLYRILRTRHPENAIDVVNRIINIQEELLLAGQNAATRYNFGARIDNHVLLVLRDHIVNNGHYGYIPFVPNDPALIRISHRQFTTAYRLEINEPRSYFNPSPELSTLAQEYSIIIKDRLSDLFFPGVVSKTLAIDPVHTNGYVRLISKMREEAEFLILDVRNGEYLAEEMDFLSNAHGQTIRIKARPLRTDQMRNGLQPDDANGINYHDTNKRIFLYILVEGGRVIIKTIFPGNSWNPIPSGFQAAPPLVPLNMIGI